jgi:hypothetical protein
MRLLCICSYLFEALSEAGRTDVALQMAQTRTFPGWVYMVCSSFIFPHLPVFICAVAVAQALQGATTIWETWYGSQYQQDASWNHIMFGGQVSASCCVMCLW